VGSTIGRLGSSSALRWIELQDRQQHWQSPEKTIRQLSSHFRPLRQPYRQDQFSTTSHPSPAETRRRTVAHMQLVKTADSLGLRTKFSKIIRHPALLSLCTISLMPRKLSYSSIDKKTSPSPRAREVPSPPPYPRSSSAISDNSEKGNDSSSSSEDEEERQERQIKKKSLMGLFALTVAIGGAQIVASVLSALVPPLCLSVWNVS